MRGLAGNVNRRRLRRGAFLSAPGQASVRFRTFAAPTGAPVEAAALARLLLPFAEDYLLGLPEGSR